MATLKVYRNGVKTYRHGVGTHERVPRGEVVGWNAGTARRQRDWLWTVEGDELSGYGYAVTLTLKDLPADAVEFHKLRRAWLRRVERMGATRVHWVVEWQRRMVPHIHAAVYFDRELIPLDGPYPIGVDLRQNSAGMLATHWLEPVRGAGMSAEFFSQDVKPITGAIGWLKYQSKHASRGASHYQRVGHPESWTKTGRMWGHTGEWPTIEPIVIPDISGPEFYALRRICRGWAMADARKSGDLGRVRYLKVAGRPSNARDSRMQGVAEWIPEHVMLRVIEWLTK